MKVCMRCGTRRGFHPRTDCRTFIPRSPLWLRVLNYLCGVRP